MNTSLVSENYRSTITTHLSSLEAWRKIQEVWLWWTSYFEGSSRQLNDQFTVRFGPTFVTFRVAEIDEGRKIVWEVEDCYLDWLQNKQEWKATFLVWELITEGKETRIDFTHLGLVPEIECYQDCVKGWNFYAKESLLKLLNEGVGLPETPKNLR